MIKAVIIGAGTYGEVYAEYIRDSRQFELNGFLDDDTSKIGKTINQIKVLGPLSDLASLKKKGIQAIFAPLGDNDLRIKMLDKSKRLGFDTPGFIHPTAIIHHTVKLGRSVYILSGTHIMPHTNISDFTMISMGVNVAHHVTVEKGCFLSMGSNVGASLTIGSMTFIGISSTLMTGIHRVGKNVLVGAGSVVVSDIPDNKVVTGVPAKILRNR